MADLVWADPPPKRGGRTASNEYIEIAQQLRGNPGCWALIKTVQGRSHAQSISNRIKTGEIIAFRPTGDYDAQVRLIDGEYRIYARKT